MFHESPRIKVDCFPWTQLTCNGNIFLEKWEINCIYYISKGPRIAFSNKLTIYEWQYNSTDFETFFLNDGRGQLKCDGTRVETRFRLSAKWTSLFKSAGASVQSTTGNWGVRISGINAGYTVFRGSMKGTGCSLHSPVSPSRSLPASQCAVAFQLKSTSVALCTVFCQTVPKEHFIQSILK